MKAKTGTRILALAAGVLALTAALARVSPAQEEAPEHAAHHAEAAAASEAGTMPPACQRMMQARQRLTSQIEARAATLQELVAALDAAADEAKIQVLEKLVRELAAQSDEMSQYVTIFPPRMMDHMMSHMQGQGAGMKCPAMASGMGTEQAGERSP